MDEVQEYESLKSGAVVVAEINNLSELPLALIKARIANGLTQAELAEKVGVKMQQIQRYEAERYESASMKTLEKIAGHLNLGINADIRLKSIAAPEELDVKNYPFRQMFKRNWFGNFSGDFNEAVKDSANLIANFFESAGLPEIKYSFNRKSVRTGSKVNSFALMAWYAKVVLKSVRQLVKVPFDRQLLTDQWLKDLAQLSQQEDALLKVTPYLNDVGIRLIIESPLDGTFLDGAALLLSHSGPIIALTLRHDRLDNFWFVLFHEIAHVKLHLDDERQAIFDDLDLEAQGIEKEADQFALNALIPDLVWKKSLVRYSPSSQTIINQAKELNIGPSLVAGRIRKETGRYHLFNDLIGIGEVRKCFTQELSM